MAKLMTLDEIRKRTIIALFSDDKLIDQIVLKGGNALRLIHRATDRASIDLDFSLEHDFEDLDDTRKRILHVLSDRFDSVGYVVFDARLEPRPQIRGTDERPWWGGYQLEFKVIDREKYAQLSDRPEKLRIASLPTGPGQRRVLRVDFSKSEYTAGKREFDIENYVGYVYSLEMLVVEKLRALCQQMKEYSIKESTSARARDFYDIHAVVTSHEIDLATEENRELVRLIFGAKRVPISLLGKLSEYRELHRPDWPAVVNASPSTLEPYDYYFDFVVDQVERLEPFWIEDSPI